MFRCSFIKTCVYTCTSSEQQLIHICLHFIAHLYSLYAHVSPSFDDFLIYTCFAYLHVLLHVYVICISNVINIHVYPLSHLPSCNLSYGLFLCLGYVCILLVLDKNIQIPRSLFLNEKWIFMFLFDKMIFLFHLSFIAYFSWKC